MNAKTPPPAEPPAATRRGTGGALPNAPALLSHDIRSALSDVLGGLSLIADADVSPAARVQFDRLRAAADTLKALLDDALESAEAQGRSVTMRQRIETGRFLESLRRRWAGRAAALDTAFSFGVEGNLPAVITLDPVALDRVVANLMSNAIKYAAGGAVGLQVRLEADEALCIEVNDDGPGLSDAALASLYAFEGRPTNSGKPGSGMGLFIAAELAEALGGRLAVTNRDRGVSACLTLPRAAWHDPGHAAAPTPAAREARIDLRGLRVLLAEDNPTNQLVASQMLEALNARCEVVADGEAALAALTTGDYDLGLIDIEMPRMSGLEVIRAVRGSGGKQAEMPLVALTAYVMQEHRARIMDVGASGIIAKPVPGIDALGEAILAHAPLPDQHAGADRDTTDGGALEGPDADVLDRLLASVGPEVRHELFDKLESDLAAVAGRIAGAVGDTLQWEDIRGATHVLTSVAGIVGDTDLQEAAARLNALAHDEDAARARPLAQECADSIGRLRAWLNAKRQTGAATA